MGEAQAEASRWLETARHDLDYARHAADGGFTLGLASLPNRLQRRRSQSHRVAPWSVSGNCRSPRLGP